MNLSEQEPTIIPGGMAVDDRGCLRFANDFNFSGVKRFYQVSNHTAGFVRAWHAHKREAKFVYAASGTILVGATKIDNWENPSKGLRVHRFILSAMKPSLVYIPSGFANGFKTLSDDSSAFFFSTTNLAESQGDDFRFDARYWDIWDIEER